MAAAEVQCELQRMGFGVEEGKMFGVLVVACPEGMQASHGGRLAFLAAYSGLLNGRNDWPYFVPSVFDAQQPDGHFKQVERDISAINETLAAAPENAEQLKSRRRQLSEELQLWLFHHYRLLNARGEEKDLVEIWQDYHCSPRIRNKYPLPPGGTGDCCAPKLLQYAYSHGLHPLCMAEFWWGPSPKSEVRHHRQFYPSCRGKCKPLLTWMMQGLDVDVNPETLGFPHLGIDVVYEDEALLVVNKPSGMLSVPGRMEDYSVATVVADMRPGALLAHRLDMGTSGLMVAGKTIDAYHALQQQFVSHVVRKRYVALLNGRLSVKPQGEIRLPLLCDPINRPRQVVDYNRGKTAVTDYELLGVYGSFTLVALYPHTGRTHQLRVHCAHADGLGCPIVGDGLYGYTLPLPDHSPSSPSPSRLCLHAEQIWLQHPQSGQPMHFVLPHPFDNIDALCNK